MKFPNPLFKLAISVFASALLCCAPEARPNSQSRTAGIQLTLTNVLPADWGKTFAGVMRSQALGTDRKFNVYLPRTFDKTSRKYPVVFVTDGEYYFQRAVTAVRQLSAASHIPECIVVAIETPDRRQDMTPPGMSPMHSDGPDQRGEKFMKFIVNELLPELKAKYRAGAPNVLMGHSHGGILCAYAAAEWRNDLPFVVALDAPMHLDDGLLSKDLVTSIAAKGNLRLVSLEAKFGWSDKEWTALTTAAPKTWQLSRIKLPDEDHETMVFEGFYRGLKTIFSDYSAVKVKNLDGAKAFERYRGLESAYGGAVIPPQFVLQRAVMDLTFFGRGDEARKALQMWGEGYGEVPGREEMLADIAKGEAYMKGKETVEQLLAKKWPSPDQMKPYLGVWKGHAWLSIDESQKSPITVTFALEKGAVVASFRHDAAPAGYGTPPLKYLQMAQGGLDFGYLNGMTPRGILAYQARGTGNHLEGQVEFRGTWLNPNAPKHFFSITKVK
jgi:hypothetical protein